MGRRDLIEPRAIREFGVARRQFHERTLLTPLWHQNPDPAFGPARQPLFHRLDVLDLHWQIDLACGWSNLVELAEGGLHDVTITAGNRAGIRTQLDSFDDAAATNLEDLDRAAARADLDAEHIAVPEAGGRHLLLPVAQRLDGSHRIAQLRGLLEAFGASRVFHACAQGIGELVVAALEQQPRVDHGQAVTLVRADLRDARRDTALDVVLETRPRPRAGNHFVARPDAKQPVGQRHGPPGDLGWQKRTGVEVVVSFNRPCNQNARVRLAGSQPKIGVVLVVP